MVFDPCRLDNRTSLQYFDGYIYAHFYGILFGAATYIRGSECDVFKYTRRITRSDQSFFSIIECFNILEEGESLFSHLICLITKKRKENEKEYYELLFEIECSLSIRAAYSVLREMTKHIEVDCDLIRDKLLEGSIQSGSYLHQLTTC